MIIKIVKMIKLFYLKPELKFGLLKYSQINAN